jgi:hypothetical protein
MGKKEKDIKRQNDDFYKEYNYIRDDKKDMAEEDMIVYEENKAELQDDKFDDMLLTIKRNILEYVDHQGLPLCEKLDDVNLETYVNYVLSGCPVKINTSHNEILEENVGDNFDIDVCNNNIKTLTSEIDKIQSEINNTKEAAITKLGEHDIFLEYIKSVYPDDPDMFFKESTIFPLLRKRMIKMSGNIEKYNDWVTRVGSYEYKKLSCA